MILTSNEWNELHKQKLLPETNLEITCRAATDPTNVDNINDLAPDTASSFSTVSFLHRDEKVHFFKPTLEHNLWILDGSGSFRDGTHSKFYANESVAGSGVEIVMKSPTTTAIPGVTITWALSETEGCASKFAVTVFNGNTVLATKTINNNKDLVSVVDMVIDSYDRITVDILEWSLPGRRSRIFQVVLGQNVVFTKGNIFGYEHEQQGHPNAGELTRNIIRFSIDNHDGIWDPMNPSGFYKFLTKRLPVDVRYGLFVDGVMEWIQAGRFFLSDWSVPSNGLEASFTAKDIFESLQTPVKILSGSTLKDWVSSVATHAVYEGVSFSYTISALAGYTAGEIEEGSTGAVIIQRCANAGSCLIRHPRVNNGGIVISKDIGQAIPYKIPLSLSYSHPEITFSKPLKAVSVSYAGGAVSELAVSTVGETQTVDNTVISTEEQALEVATWVKNALEPRITVKGEFRANPCLDVFDVVTVESKYGNIYPVLITYLKYTYNGSFRASYEGRVINIPEGA